MEATLEKGGGPVRKDTSSVYSFDDFSSSSVDKFAFMRLKSISSALALPVSRGRHAKLVDNFSHESQTSRPQRPLSNLLLCST